MAYTDTDELTRILKLRSPSTEQVVAMQRVIDLAAGEIDSEIDLSATADPLTATWQVALLEQINLDRAAELWRNTESLPGVTGLADTVGVSLMSDKRSWDERFAPRLAPLKDQFGVA